MQIELSININISSQFIIKIITYTAQNFSIFMGLLDMLENNRKFLVPQRWSKNDKVVKKVSYVFGKPIISQLCNAQTSTSRHFREVF